LAAGHELCELWLNSAAGHGLNGNFLSPARIQDAKQPHMHQCRAVRFFCAASQGLVKKHT